MAEKLLPCPFCGGEASVHHEQRGERKRYFVSCEKCLLTYSAAAWFARWNYDEAAAAWNRRTEPKED